MSNPFERPAEEPKGKMSFGTLRIFTNKVNLTTGASYIADALGIDPDPDSPLNRLTYKDGNLYEFKGKQKLPNGRNTHVIVVITQRAQDGKVYNNFRDFMYWQSSVCYKVTFPSLAKHFGGPKLPGIFGKSAEVQAEVVEIEDKGYTRQAFRIIKVFKDETERMAAEQAFFGQFNQTPDEIADEMLGEDPIPFGDEEDKPVGMSKDAATALLPTLWAASGQDKDKFLAQLEGMPVVVAAVGGIDAPEVVAIYS